MEQGAIGVRHVRFRDAVGLEAFYARLSPESRALRFMGASRGITADQALHFASADGVRGDGHVAIDRSSGRIVGHVCLEPLRPGTEEIGIAVEDALQQRGIGHALLLAAVASAERRGVTSLEATMLPGNPGIHRLLEHAGIPWRRQPAASGAEMLILDLAAAGVA